MATAIAKELPAWTDVYLTELAKHGMEHTAAVAAQTTVRAVRALSEANVEFSYAVEAALEAAADVIEAELHRRAVIGIEKGVYYQGDRVATEVQYSDSLLLALAKAKRRREFGDKAEISGPGGAPLVVNIRTFGPPPADPTQPADEALTVSYRQLPDTDAYADIDAHDLV